MSPKKLLNIRYIFESTISKQTWTLEQSHWTNSLTQNNKTYKQLSTSPSAQAFNNYAKISHPKLNGKNSDACKNSTCFLSRLEWKNSRLQQIKRFQYKKHICLWTDVIEFSFWKNAKGFMLNWFHFWVSIWKKKKKIATLQLYSLPHFLPEKLNLWFIWIMYSQHKITVIHLCT